MASGLGLGYYSSSCSREKGPGSVSSPCSEPWVLSGFSRDLPHPPGFLGVQVASTAEGYVQWAPCSTFSESHPSLGVPLLLTQVPSALTTECLSHPPFGSWSKLSTPSSLQPCPCPWLSTELPTRNMRTVENPYRVTQEMRKTWRGYHLQPSLCLSTLCQHFSSPLPCVDVQATVKSSYRRSK